MQIGSRKKSHDKKVSLLRVPMDKKVGQKSILKSASYKINGLSSSSIKCLSSFDNS